MIDCLSANWMFYGCMILASVLSMVPFAGKFLNVLNTLIHESGHAVMAMLTGGGVMNIKLSADTSGAAQTKSKYWLGKVFTSLAGYPVSALIAWLFFWLIKEKNTTYVYYIILSLILINLILWVRNTFGIIWLLVMGSVSALIYLYGTTLVKYLFASFCASIVLFQSIFSAITLLIIAVNNPDKAGDAKNLKEFTFIPAIIWSLLMLSFVSWVSYKIFFLMPCL